MKEKIDEEIERIVKELRSNSDYDGLFKTNLNQYGIEVLVWDPEQKGIFDLKLFLMTLFQH